MKLLTIQSSVFLETSTKIFSVVDILRLSIFYTRVLINCG